MVIGNFKKKVGYDGPSVEDDSLSIKTISMN